VFGGGDLYLFDEAAQTFTFSSNINQAPIALDDAALTQKNVSVITDVLMNDSDPDYFDVLGIAEITVAPTSGVASINGDNMITYTPSLDFFGNDVFTYEVTDGYGGFDTAEVFITVEEGAPPPPPPPPSGETIIGTNGAGCSV